MKIIVLIFILILSSCSDKSSKKEPPKVKNGVLDLSTWNFKKDGYLNLEGDWFYYWNKRVEAKDILKKGIPKGSSFIKVPGNWKGNDEKKIPATGYATYVLKINGLRKGLNLAMDSPRVFSSYNLKIINGPNIQEVLKAGEFAKFKEKEVPQFKRGKKYFKTRGNSLILVLNISNFHFRNGKIDSSFKMGLKTDIENIFENKLYKDLAIIGFLFFSFIYHVGLYTQRREAKDTLYFGLFCGVVCLRHLVLSYFISWYFGNPSKLIFEIEAKLNFITITLMPVFFGQYLEALFKNNFKSYFKLNFIIFWITLPLFLFFEAYIFTNILLLTSLNLVIFVGIVYVIFKLMFLSFKKVEYALPIFLGFIVLGIGVSHDVFIQLGKFFDPPEIGPQVVSLFIFFKSYILSIKFSNSFKMEKALTKELGNVVKDLNQAYGVIEKNNEELEEIVTERTQQAVDAKNKAENSEKEVSNLLNNMAQSVFSIERSGIIIPPVSQFSQSIFGQSIEGKNVFDIVYKDFIKGSENFEQVVFAINVIMGADILQYDMICHLLPTKVLIKNNENEIRSLKIIYSPILENEEVVKIMFVVEDITDFEKLEKEAKENQELSEIKVKRLQEIISNEKHRFMFFLKDVYSNYELIDNSIENEDWDKVFRSVHTLKGNAREFNLSGLSSELHLIENDIIKKNNIKEVCAQIKEKVNNYITLSKEIYGDDISNELKNSNSNTVEIEKKKFLDGIDKIKSIAISSGKEDILRIIKTFEFEKFNDILLGLQSIVKKIANSLNKKISLSIEGHDIYLDLRKTSMLKDSIMHIVQNSCDHGIENEGDIKIDLLERDDEIEIKISDNGRGIDHLKVREKAIERGVLTLKESDELNDEDALNLILIPGFSTKDIATEFSGRGVGLDVVSTNVKKMGGNLIVSSTVGEGTTFEIKISKS